MEFKFELSNVDFVVSEVMKGIRGEMHLSGDLKGSDPTEEELEQALSELLTSVISQVHAYSMKDSIPQTVYNFKKCGTNVFFAVYQPSIYHLEVYRCRGEMWVYSSQGAFASRSGSTDLSSSVSVG